MSETCHYTGYCVLCGEDFTDGDAGKDRADGTVHPECERIEEAVEATWGDSRSWGDWR